MHLQEAFFSSFLFLKVYWSLGNVYVKYFIFEKNSHCSTNLFGLIFNELNTQLDTWIEKTVTDYTISVWHLS